MTARDDVLARIRSAIAGGTAPASIPPIERTYQRVGERSPGSDAVLDLLVDRLEDYKATVERTSPVGLAEALDRALGPATSVVLPAGLPAGVVEGCRDRRVVVDGEPAALSPVELDRIAAVVTEATVAIALTGTIILDGRPGQGRRAISLVPDLHVLVLRAEQVVETVPEGLSRLDPTRPITMISGPSATSDIELSRVEGVHGPRTLRVVLI